MTIFLFLRKSFYDDSYLLAIFLKKQRTNNIDTIFEPSYALFVYKLYTKGDSSHRRNVYILVSNWIFLYGIFVLDLYKNYVDYYPYCGLF